MKVVVRQPEVSVPVSVPDRALAEAVAELFPVLSVIHERVDLHDDAPSAASGGLVVQRAGERLRLGEAGRPDQTLGSLSDLLVVLEERVLARLLEPVAGWVHLHAAGVLTAAGAVLALGPSGAGKSSLALAWARAGRPVLGDDLLLVAPDGRVRGFPRLAKVHRDRLSEHGLAPEDTLAPSTGHAETWVDLHRDGPWRPGLHRVVRVSAVQYEPRAPSAAGVPRAMGGSALLQLLMGQRLSTGASGVEALDALVALAAGARGERRSFRQAAAAATDLASAETPVARPSTDGRHAPGAVR